MSRPPAFIGIAVVVAALSILSVAWMMSLRMGGRIAGEAASAEGPQDQPMADQSTGSMPSLPDAHAQDVTAVANKDIRIAFQVAATMASQRLAAGQQVVLRMPDGAIPSVCGDGGVMQDVQLTLTFGDGHTMEQGFAVVAACA